MEMIQSFPANSNYLTDMNFLNERVWPIAQRDVLQVLQLVRSLLKDE